MHQMCEQLALLGDLKRRNIMIVEDALKFKKDMLSFKVFSVYLCFFSICHGT